MESAEKTVVTMIYQVFTDDGRIIDQAFSDEPFKFVVGDSGLPPEVEQTITGLEVGEIAEFPLPPRTPSFQVRDPVILPTSALPEGVQPAMGTGLWLTDNEQQMPVWIIAADDKTVSLTAQHPFDELDVRVKVQILDVETTDT